MWRRLSGKLLAHVLDCKSNGVSQDLLGEPERISPCTSLSRTNRGSIDRGALTAQNERARSEHPRPRKGLRPRLRSIRTPRSIVLFQPGADAGTRKGIRHARAVRPVRRLPTQFRTAT